MNSEEAFTKISILIPRTGICAQITFGNLLLKRNFKEVLNDSILKRDNDLKKTEFHGKDLLKLVRGDVKVENTKKVQQNNDVEEKEQAF